MLLTSVKDLEMGWVAEPEITQSGCDATFTPALALTLFNQDQSNNNVVTFLNPENFFNFETSYNSADWTTITSIYGLS